MSLHSELESEVSRTVFGSWQTRDGLVVPEAEDVALGNVAVRFEEATVLYADLAESTKLVAGHVDFAAAEVYKSFLTCASRIIKRMGGSITAFDGDRVMAVYIGPDACSAAVKTGLKIATAVRDIVNPTLRRLYAASFTTDVTHAVGIDISPLFVARTGVRGANDLVWVGRAANYAAKLSTLREQPFSLWITSEVYRRLDWGALYGGTPAVSIWQQRNWSALPGVELYRSSWQRPLDAD